MTNLEIDSQFFQNFLPQFKYVKFLGQGAFAKVYLIKNQMKKLQLAVKKVSFFGMCQYQKQNVLNQVKILSNVNHPNIIKFNSCVFDSQEDNIYILMQYANGGDLMEFINKTKNYIKQNVIWRVIADIAQALNYLHKKGIIHRDIKPANILIQGDSFKLADMNISKIVKKNASMTYTKLGTPLYTSPQMTNLSKQKGYNQKCDIWSLGVVIYQLCCLKNPFNLQSLNQISKNKCQALFQIPLSYSQTLSNLVNQMLQKNPQKRTSIRYILEICQMQGVKLHKQTHSITQFKTIILPQSSQRWINITSLRSMKEDLSKYLNSNNKFKQKDTQMNNFKKISIRKENPLQLTIDQRLNQQSSIVVNQQLDEYGLKLFDLNVKNILKNNIKQKRQVQNGIKQNRIKQNGIIQNRVNKYVQENKGLKINLKTQYSAEKYNQNHHFHPLKSSRSKQNSYKFHRSHSKDYRLLKQKQYRHQNGKNQRQIPGKYIKLSRQFMRNS